MRHLFLHLSLIILCGCAKFGLDLSSFSSTNNGLNILIPNPSFLAQPDEVITISGVCQAGADLNITGSGMVGGINMLCASDGTFTNSITLVNDGENLPIVVTQTDNTSGQVLVNNDSVNLTTHCSPAPMASCSLSGSGRSSVDPYIINNVACLQEMRVNPACHFALNNDIDATVTSTWNAGEGWEPAGSLTGSINGRGFRVHGLTINRPTENDQGLFASINGDYGSNPSELTVDNLVLEDFDITAGNRAGALASNIFNTRISNLQIINSSINTDPTENVLFSSFGGIGQRITSSLIENNQIEVSMNLSRNTSSNRLDSIGGIAGSVNAVEITNSNINFSIVTTGHTGALVHIGGVIGNGNGTDSTLSNLTVSFNANLETTFSSGSIDAVFNIGGITGSGDTILSQSETSVNININSTSDTVSNIGGITGDSVFGTYAATTSSASGTISVTSPSTNSIGGLVGTLERSDFTNCSTDVDIDLSASTNNSNIGGTAGTQSLIATLTNITQTGSLNVGAPNSNVGAFLGSRSTLTALDCFYDSDISNVFPSVGAGASTGITGLTTANMYLQSSFPSFDFTNTWQINNGVSYPELQ